MILGGVVRTDKTKREIRLVFTAHDKGEGGEIVRSVLKKHNIKASFFFTGDFYRNAKFTAFIKALKKDGHYLGAHSDKHLLYAPWEKRDSLLISREDFVRDLRANYAEMEKFGVKKEDAKYFLPPFEWYNEEISRWAKELGLELVNFTPGTRSNADYTSPLVDKNYVSSDDIYKSIMNFEKSDKNGLNGFILLTHIAATEGRKDLFYNRLDSLITELEGKGYIFTRFK
ncbi:MAG TPA: polysaccharide deacetylase family protein [Ignavibacteriales bacterium]|nr:polysaccharide deacetylase family protein [Ignavibacteriales bacterium]